MASGGRPSPLPQLSHSDDPSHRTSPRPAMPAHTDPSRSASIAEISPRSNPAERSITCQDFPSHRHSPFAPVMITSPLESISSAGSPRKGPLVAGGGGNDWNA